MSLCAILLAGGNSSRFPSPTPKVVYPFADKPIIEHLIDTLNKIQVSEIIIVSGPKTDSYLRKYESASIRVYRQTEPLGTFDALLTGANNTNADNLLVINADTPLVRPELLREIITSSSKNVITAIDTQRPSGLGRIFKDEQGQLFNILEQKQLEPHQMSITLVNAGVYKLNTTDFFKAIKYKFDTPEQYLTSYLGSYKDFTLQCEIIEEAPLNQWTLQGINTYKDFEQLESDYFRDKREKLISNGAILKNASEIFDFGTTHVCPGVIITGPCVFKGTNKLGAGTTIEPFTSLKDTTIGEHSHIYEFCHLDQSEFGDDNYLGPFLRARVDVKTESKVYLGNFLEVKSSVIGHGTKAKHFGYIGDGLVGKDCNIGAGCIFCNYDGHKKQRTVLKDSVFVGAASQFVAPLTIEQNCYIGASTLITRSLSEGSTAIRRAPLKTINKKITPRS